MLRLLGLMPSTEPTELEKAEARIMEQTGYTSLTIEGFKQQIREGQAQLRAVEESLTTRILLLQKERDEALLGQGVGLSARAPLQPASDDVLSSPPVADSDPFVCVHAGGVGDGVGAGGLADEQIQHYETQIEQLNAHIQQMQMQLEQAHGDDDQHWQQQQQQQQHEPGFDEQDEQQPHHPQQHQQSSRFHAPDGSYAASSSASSSAAAASADSISPAAAGTLTARTSQAEDLRSEMERLTAEKEQLEKHLAGVLASPAVANVAGSPANQSQQRGALNASPDEDGDSEREQLVSATQQNSALAQQLREEQQRVSDMAAYIRQLEEGQQHMQQQMQYMQQQAGAPSQDGAASSSQQHQQQVYDLQRQLSAQQQQLDSLYASLQQAESHAQAADAEVARLQSQLLQLQSVEQQPPAATTADSADVQQLKQQLSQLQSLLQQQSAAASEEKRRTQATLTEKLAQIKTIISSKDTAIAQLKAQLAALQQHSPSGGAASTAAQMPSRQQPAQQQQQHPSPSSALGRSLPPHDPHSIDRKRV